MSTFKTFIANALSGALVASQISLAAAAPLPTNVATMKSMVVDGPTQVYWRGGWGWGLGFGALAGAIIGGAIASSAYGYYGAPYYGYAHPYAGYYAPHPAYYGYGPYYGSYGYYRPYPVYGYPHYYRHYRDRYYW